MSMDDTDNNSPGDKKPPTPKQVVVTHYGKKKKDTDVPSEIMPTEPTHIISSPVDIGSMPKTTTTMPQPQQKVQESITPATPVQSQPKVEPKITPTLPPVTPKTAPTLPRQEIFPSQVSEPPRVAASYASSSSENESPKQPYSGGGNMPPETPSYREKPPSGGSGGNGALFFSVVSLVAVIVLGYYANATYQQLSELQKQTSDEQGSVQALSEQTKKTLIQMQDQNVKSEQAQHAMSELKQQLMNAQANLVTLSGNTDWVLAEANYLAFMANERLKTAQDVTTALAQLTSADERISRLGNPALLWVRDVLAKDIAKLRNYPDINRQALWEQLGLVSNQFNQLHFKSVSNGSASNLRAPENADTNMSTWEKALWRTWQELKSIIKITQVAQNSIPLALTQQEQAQILYTLKLMNEQARWAILQGENKIYHQNLQSMTVWLNEYFADDTLQKELLSQIKELEQQNIDISMPDISDSVQALSKAMIEFVNKPTQKLPQRDVQ